MITGGVLTPVDGKGSQDHAVAKMILGSLAMTRGMDFKGNTSSADAKLLSPEGGTDVFSDVSSNGFSDGFSVAVGFMTGISVEADNVDTFKST